MFKLFYLFTYHFCTHVSVKQRWVEREQREMRVRCHACMEKSKDNFEGSQFTLSTMSLRLSLLSFLPLHCICVHPADSSVSISGLAMGTLGLGL